MVDVNYYYFKFLGYYKKDGGELFNYVECIDILLVVWGNFRFYVNIKFEFNMLKLVIEKILFVFSDVDVYNLNDGVKIVGSFLLE